MVCQADLAQWRLGLENHDTVIHADGVTAIIVIESRSRSHPVTPTDASDRLMTVGQNRRPSRARALPA